LRMIRGIQVLLFLLLPAAVRADFKLPILNRVPKILSVNDDVTPEQLLRFSSVRDLILEIHLVRSNRMPEPLMQVLLTSYKNTPKRIFLSQEIKPAHVEQLRTLGSLEVLFSIPAAGLDSKLANALYSIGPVPKTLFLPMNFDKEAVASVRKMHFSTPAVVLSPELSLSKEQIEWLSEIKERRKLVVLDSGIEPQKLYEWVALAPLALEIKLVKNRIPDPLLAVLKDLKGVDITLVADGRMTMEDARQWSRLDHFSLKLEITDPNEVTPGLAQLLNQIAPGL
jgi:hypothetical protein